MGRAISLLAVILSVSVPGGRLAADFHLMRISEVLVGAGGDCRIQFVELQMTAAGQNRVGGHRLTFFDAAGDEVGSYTFPNDVANAENGSFILIGTQELADASEVIPDFILPAGLLMPHGGRVAFETVDAVAYGDFSGDNGAAGAPAPGFTLADLESLTRVADTGQNAADFQLADPTPANNAGATGPVTPPEPECYLVDDFADLSNWDLPAANEGLDFELCVGEPQILDIGSVSLGENVMILEPGMVDLGFGVPIVITGLSVEAAELFADLPSYRVRFDFVASQGIVFGAVHLHQHYRYDPDTETFDLSQASSMGMNFSFDDITEDSDHIHDDNRGVCLTESGDSIGDGSPDFTPESIPDQRLRTGRRHTVIMDTDGDDVEGPLWLQVKFFQSDQPEPEEYFATWELPFGIAADPDPELDHGVLIAALGVNGSTMEVSNFSVCEVPRSQKFVRDLTCVREIDDSILVSWRNPTPNTPEDEEAEITIVVNGVQVDRVAGDETFYEVADPPLDDTTIEVINYSCVPVSCSLCFNDEPEAVIEGPASATLEGGTAAVRLDSTGSSDEEQGGGSLVRLWSVAAKPEGSTATLDSFDGTVVNLTVDSPGEYRVELTVTDSGCTGDGLDSKIDSTTHTVTVTEEPLDIIRRADANGDGQVNIADAQYSLNRLFLGGPPHPCEEQADANGDGSVNIADPQYSLNHLFLGGPPPPAPFPGCGPVEGGLRLGCATITCQ